MEIDLSDRNITELRFDRDETEGGGPGLANTPAAKTVRVVSAARNRITRIVGLGTTFVSLSELHLSHNSLGVSTTPPYVARQHARHAAIMAARQGNAAFSSTKPLCCGLPDWIASLPPTLEVLNLSFNQLCSFIACTCGQSGAAGDHEKDMEVNAAARVRFLRHACPLALSLFFPATRFPRLRHLDLSHNALATNLRESDEMEDAWQQGGDGAEAPPMPATACAAATVDLSFNPGLAAPGCLLLHSSFPTATSERDGERATGLRSLSLAETGVDDLVALSSVGFHADQLTDLRLHSTPLSCSLGTAPQSVLADLLVSLVLPALTRRPSASRPVSSAEEKEGAALPAETLTSSFEQTAIAKALQDLAAHRLRDLDQALSESVGHEVLASRRSQGGLGGGSLTTLPVCIYAALILEVVPTLEHLDGTIDVRKCKDAVMSAVQSALLLRSRGRATKPAEAAGPVPAQTELRRQPSSLSALAAAVTPQLRPKVIVQEEAEDSASVTDSGDGVRDPSGKCEQAHEQGDCTSGGAPTQTLSAPTAHRFRATLDALRPLVQEGGGTSSGPSASGDDEDKPNRSSAGSRTAATTGGEADWFTPTGLTFNPDAAARYEALCAEAAQLEEELLRAGERREGLREALGALKQQLAEDRRLIGDQRKEGATLRERRDGLRDSVQQQREKLKRRQRDITYGKDAMRSQASTARQKERAKQLEERERAIEKKEKAWQRRMAQMGALAVNYHHSDLPSGETRKAKPIRSVVLREAATRRKLEELGSKEPLAYSPTRFHEPLQTSNGVGEKAGEHDGQRHRSPPRAAAQGRSSSRARSRDRSSAVLAMLEEDESTYFEAYRQRNDGGDAADADGVAAASLLPATVAEEYCRALSPDQRRQLQDVIAASKVRSPYGGSSGSGSRLTSPARSPHTSAAPRGARSGRTEGELKPPPPLPPTPPVAKLPPPASPAASPVRDLSSLSLTELFEAAASIRQRQLALQQLQDAWQEQKRVSASASVSPNKRRGEEPSPLPVVSPATPQPAVSQPVPGGLPDSATALRDAASEAPSSVAAGEEEGDVPPGRLAVQTEQHPARGHGAPPSTSPTTAFPEVADAPVISRALFS